MGVIKRREEKKGGDFINKSFFFFYKGLFVGVSEKKVFLVGKNKI